MATYTIKVNASFCAAHALRGYQGDCARVHGHNWKVEAEVISHQLDKLGISLDFKDLRDGLQQILAGLDHQFLNEISPFDKINPTAENVVAWIFAKLQQQIKAPNKLQALTLWETDKCSIRYSND